MTERTVRSDRLSTEIVPQFGALLRQLRRRAGLTQAELAAAVNLSIAQISRLEQDERLPDVKAVAQQFVPALGLNDEPRLAHRLVELAAAARGEPWSDPAPTTTLPQLIAASAANLPILPIRVIGRTAFLAQAQQRLLERDGRLLTLLGPPGIGKTTVALALATQVQDLFDHGAVFVALAPLQEVERVAAAILEALGVSENNQDRPPRIQLIGYLRQKRLLLVLDNFDHLTAAAPLVGELLAAAPGLHLLVTSRSPLNLRAERRLRVPPLEQEPAIELFVVRAQAIEADFALTPVNRPLVGELCAGLDYLPLAIELAASRIDLLSPAELVAQAQENRLLATGQGAIDHEHHQQTLRAAIDRSYALLSVTQQFLFRVLGVFVGRFDLAGVQAVVHEMAEDNRPELAAAEVAMHLTALVNRSLVSPGRRPEGTAQFHLLETLRAYAVEQLVACGEHAKASAAHARYLTQLARDAYLARDTGASVSVQSPWWSVLEENQENVRAALAWLLDHDRTCALQLAVRLHPYWEVRSHQREGSRWLNLALAQEPGSVDLPLPLLAEGLCKAGNFAQQLSDYTQATDLLARALVAYRKLGDDAGIATTLRAQGWLASDRSERHSAIDAFTASLAIYRTLKLPSMIANVLCDLVHVLGDPGREYAQAQAYAAESLEIFRSLGDLGGIAYALQQTGMNETRVGHYAAAAAAYIEALGLWRRLQATREIGWALEQVGEAMWHQGQVDAAQAYWIEALELFTLNEVDYGIMLSQHHLAQVARIQQDWASALQRYGVSLGYCWAWQNLAMTARCLAGIGSVLATRGRHAPAAQFLAVAQRLIDEHPPFLAPADHREFAQMIDTLRTLAGEDAFARLWAEGSRAGVEETVTLALSMSGEPAVFAARPSRDMP